MIPTRAGSTSQSVIPAVVNAALAVVAALSANAAEVKVDFSRETGPVKPVNGVGQPPMLGFGGDSLFHYLTEAAVPFSRLHDTGGAFGRNVYVDIPNLFRDFDADENDPASYDFTFTDDLMVKLDKAGVRPYFRLGVTIENASYVKAYRIFPPKDFAKWARICEHVMAHYVEGWAGGPRVKVSHWEIWNEADLDSNLKWNAMWQGTFEEFIRLYVTAAKHLKARFPNEKIGGFGSCGFYAAATDVKTERAVYHVKCIEEFFAAVKRENAPLDFFSFHSYAGVADTMKHVSVAREFADRYGYKGIELSLNEWLPAPSRQKLGTAQQAAEIAAELVGLQNSTLDSACVYDARCGVGSYSPLFNPLTYKPHKAYWAFLAFGELKRAGTAVSATSDDPNVWVAAATGKTRAVMVANDGEKEVPLKLDLGGLDASTCRIVDAERTWEEVPVPSVLPAHSFFVRCATAPEGTRASR